MIYPRLVLQSAASVFLGLLAVAPLAAQDAAMQPDCEDIEATLSEGLETLSSIQGVSVAVFTPQGSCTIGLGVTDIETQEAVTTDTAFYIASSTKSMLALALAAMAARDEIALDQPIGELAPTAPFPKAIQADRITLRHLLAMSSGIKNPAYVHRVAFSGEHTQTQLWDLIGATQRNRARDIRFGKFRYTNWNYNLAARLVEEKRSTRWQDFLHEEIFDKLGLTRTTAYMSLARSEGWSLARPHATLEPGGTIRTYLEKVDATMHSAGGVVMSANDALRWLALFVEDGRVGGRQIVPSDVIRSTREPLTQVDAVFNGFERKHYGLGWYLGPYRDTNIQLVHHFGGFSGARAHISYMPDKDIGVAIFVNDSMVGSRFIDTAARYVYDRFLGVEGAHELYRSEIAQTKAWADDTRARVRSLRSEIAARPWDLALPIADHAGTYAHDDFGTIEITYRDGLLQVRNGQTYAMALPGAKENTVRIELIPLQGEELVFNYGRAKRVKSLIYQGVRYDRMD